MFLTTIFVFVIVVLDMIMVMIVIVIMIISGTSPLLLPCFLCFRHQVFKKVFWAHTQTHNRICGIMLLLLLLLMVTGVEGWRFQGRAIDTRVAVRMISAPIVTIASVAVYTTAAVRIACCKG